MQEKGDCFGLPTGLRERAVNSQLSTLPRPRQRNGLDFN